MPLATWKATTPPLRAARHPEPRRPRRPGRRHPVPRLRTPPKYQTNDGPDGRNGLHVLQRLIHGKSMTYSLISQGISNRPARLRLVLAGAMSVLLAPGALTAAPPGAPQVPRGEQAQEGATITPNYKDADINQIIQAVGEVTGKNFIIDPRVNAKVTMLSSTPMSPAAFYEAFLSVLQVYGYAAVPAGKVIKIIPNTDVRQSPSLDLPLNVSSTSDEIVTQIITMKKIRGSPLVPLLRLLASSPNGHMLLISARASNVARIIKIIERMDESGDEPIEVIPLHNASASDVVRTLNQLNQGAGAAEGGTPVKLVADERTNSVLLSGEKSLRLKQKALILDLDTPRAGGAGDTEVRYLLYADAEKLADKLKGQASASAKAQGGPQGGGGGASDAGGAGG